LLKNLHRSRKFRASDDVQGDYNCLSPCLLFIVYPTVRHPCHVLFTERLAEWPCCKVTCVSTRSARLLPGRGDVASCGIRRQLTAPQASNESQLNTIAQWLVRMIVTVQCVFDHHININMLSTRCCSAASHLGRKQVTFRKKTPTGKQTPRDSKTLKLPSKKLWQQIVI